MKQIRKSLVAFSFSLLLSFVLLEAGLAFLCASGRLRISKPSYSLNNVFSKYWADINPEFGVWHEPFSKYKHVSSCFNLTYQANSYGARDIERSKSAQGKPRVLVLGDSFVEGYGVAQSDRFSDRLEKITGIEHLNFGTSGAFGPTQYLMLYQHLAKNFEHSALIIALLPDNDFLDDDYEYGQKTHQGRLRPYFDGDYPNYKLVTTPARDPNTPARYLENFLRQFTYTGNLIKYMKGLRRHREARNALQTAQLPNDECRMTNDMGYSGYFDFSPAQWDRLKYVLEQFRAAAPDKQILVVTIPCDTDILRTEQTGEAPLPNQLTELCRSLGMNYLDLLPAIRSASNGWPSCYLSCDRHWSSYGNEIAAETLFSGGQLLK
jgi:hypothetical protein